MTKLNYNRGFNCFTYKQYVIQENRHYDQSKTLGENFATPPVDFTAGKTVNFDDFEPLFTGTFDECDAFLASTVPSLEGLVSHITREQDEASRDFTRQLLVLKMDYLKGALK